MSGAATHRPAHGRWLGAGALALGLALGGCGDDDADDDAIEDADAPAATTTTTTTAPAPPPTPLDEYTTRADAACDEIAPRFAAAFSEAAAAGVDPADLPEGAEIPDAGRPLDEVVSDDLVPAMRDIVDAVFDAGIPDGEEERVAVAIEPWAEQADRLDEDPGAFGDEVFQEALQEAARRAGGLGFATCLV